MQNTQNRIVDLKRILFIAHRSVYRGGAEDDFERIIRRVSEDRTYEIYGFLPEGPRVTDYAKHFKDYGLYRIGYFPVIYESIIEYIKYLVKYFIQARQLKKFIPGKEIKLAYLNTGVMLWLVLLLRRKDIKIIVNIKETIEPKLFRKIIYRIYSKKCSYFFSVSGYNTEDFKKLSGDNRIITVYSALEDQTGPEAELEGEIGFPNTKKLSGSVFKIINIAPVCKIKNQKLIARTVAYMREKGISNLLYVQIGDMADTKYVRQFKEIILQNRLEDNVMMLGTLQIDVMRAVLKKCDALIIPSVSEGLPIVLVEAFKSRIPVISTNNSGMSEIIRHGENGLITENNRENLCKIIEMLINDDTLSKKLTDNAFNVYEEKFNLSRNLDIMKRKFDELMQQ